jgi:two-component system chemotaxis response regulator CheB
MKRIRVLVVEDSLTVRKRLCEVLSGDPGFEVVGEAEDGKTGIELCMALRPDVITLDMMLPVMSGLAATEYLMAYCPTPILIVSSSTNRGELFKTYEALSAGAVEVMEKPRANEPEGEWERQFLSMVRVVSRVKVLTHVRGRFGSPLNAPPLLPATPACISPKSNGVRRAILALGASTGGPGAIVEILRTLPGNFPLPIVLVIHIGEPFGSTFADWLDGQTQHTVRMASDGILLGKSGVYMAPPNRHLEVRNRRLMLSDGPERHSCRPSVDVLFESVAVDYGSSAIAVLLTGMGHDGARGLLAIRKAGGMTVAQDEASCVVYGMPREAVLLGAAQRVLPLNEIGSSLMAMAES